MPTADKKAGNYWHYPDGTKQNQCPWRFIKEDPEWWYSMITAYNAYEKGFLPSPGGTDAQPALFEPIMASISSAIHAEEDYEREEGKRRDKLVEQSKTAGNAGSKPMSVPNKRRR